MDAKEVSLNKGLCCLSDFVQHQTVVPGQCDSVAMSWESLMRSIAAIYTETGDAKIMHALAASIANTYPANREKLYYYDSVVGLTWDRVEQSLADCVRGSLGI